MIHRFFGVSSNFSFRERRGEREREREREKERESARCAYTGFCVTRVRERGQNSYAFRKTRAIGRGPARICNTYVLQTDCSHDKNSLLFQCIADFIGW